MLSPEATRRMYPYQRLGVEWLYKLYSEQQGGILADDMGLVRILC